MWHLEKIIAMNSDAPAKVVSRKDADFGELVSELKQLLLVKNPELSTELKEITVDLLDQTLEALKKVDSHLIQLRIITLLCKTLTSLYTSRMPQKTERNIPVGDNTPVIRRSAGNRSCE